MAMSSRRPVPQRQPSVRHRMAAALAQSLNPEQLPARRGSNMSDTTTGPSQEDMQRRMEILMSNPELWQEFKKTLKDNDMKNRMATQAALKEFLQKNPEICAQDAAKQEQQPRRTSMMMSAFNSLSEETSQAPSARHLQTQASAGNVAMAARDSISHASSNAASMGRQYLRKAGDWAKDSIKGLDLEQAEADHRSSSMSSIQDSSSRDIVGALNEWFAGGSARSIEEGFDEKEEEEGEKE